MTITSLAVIRNRFFSGKLLTPEDLDLEQQYFRDKLKRHNRYLHGFGVVVGLEVSRRGTKVLVTPGMAIDCEGNEIIVAEPQELSLPLPKDAGATVYLSLRYVEKETDPVPAAGSADGDTTVQHSRIEETFAVAFEKENTNQGHRHFKGRWRACGTPHGLIIAKLRNCSGQWRLDRRHTRAFVK